MYNEKSACLHGDDKNQDPDVFVNGIDHVRDGLVEMGEVINDESLLDIVLEGLTDDYFQIYSSATPSRTTNSRRTTQLMRCAICMQIV